MKLNEREGQERREPATVVAGRASFSKLKVVSRRYHFHSPLLVYVVTTVVLVFGAINGQNNLLFWLFGLAVGGLIVSGFLSGSALMGIELEREVQERGEVGEPLIVRYRVKNRNIFFPSCAMVVEEVAKGPGGRHATWSKTAPACEAFLARVEPGSTGVCVAEVTPRVRGAFTFGCVRVWTTFPFGLTRKSVMFHGEAGVLVRPRRIASEPTARSRGGELSALAAHASRGREGEFYALREYWEGDSARSIAWRATARLGRPVVREVAVPPARREVVVIDVDAKSPHVEAAVAVAAGLAERACRDGVTFAVSSTWGGEVAPYGRGPRHLANTLDALALFRPGEDSTARDISGAAVITVHDGRGGFGVDASRYAGEVAAVAELGAGAEPTLTERARAVWRGAKALIGREA